jgi:hypothetical protein
MGRSIKMEPPPTDPLLGPWYFLIPCSDQGHCIKLESHTVLNFWSETMSYVRFTTWNPVEHSRLKIIFSGIFVGT